MSRAFLNTFAMYYIDTFFHFAPIAATAAAMLYTKQDAVHGL